MLAPIELDRFEPIPSSFGPVVPLPISLDRAMGHGDARPGVVHAWLAHARRCPRLASHLAMASGPGGTYLDRWRAFARCPDWATLAERLSTTEGTPTVGDDRLLWAHAAQAVAHQTGWTHPAEAYWHALIEDSQIPPTTHDLRLNSLLGPERARVVARWCLDAISSDIPRPGTEGVLAPRDAIRALDTLVGVVRVDEILDEVHAARSIEMVGLDVPTARRLAALARLAEYRQDSAWKDRLFDVISATTLEGAIGGLQPLVEACLGMRWGIWLMSDLAPQGRARWVVPNEGGKQLGFRGDWQVFEQTMLPACYRVSQDIRAEDGDLIARIYADQPMDGLVWQRWHPRIASALATFHDRLSRADSQERQKAMEQAYAEKQKKNQFQFRQLVGEFSAGAGHEINNPLGAITGHANKLLRDETEPERRHALKQVLGQVARIRQMIKDLQLIGGALPLAKTTITLRELLDETARQTEQRITIGERVFDDCDPRWQVVGDKKHLSRMLTELVVNGAESAGPAGRVRVWIERDDSNSSVEIVVSDSGPGLDADSRARAFIPFYSGREHGRGLGMGLPVAERIAQEHGGQIFLAYGKPTTVRVLLPAA